MSTRSFDLSSRFFRLTMETWLGKIEDRVLVGPPVANLVNEDLVKAFYSRIVEAEDEIFLVSLGFLGFGFF